MPFYTPEQFYAKKDDPNLADIYLEYFLLYQIYSPLVLKTARTKWQTLGWFLRENTPSEIQKLIFQKEFRFWYLSDKKLQLKLNEYAIKNAVRVLKGYQNCGVPLTQDPTIKKTRRKLTSSKGDEALKILQNAIAHQQFSNSMADLAIRSSHKLLFDPQYYRKFPITSETAESLTKQTKDHLKLFFFPTIQMTKGCVNHCSHCDCRAEPHLSHMPWPMFTALFTALEKEYRSYPQSWENRSFNIFFSDSDPVSYQDPIIQADSGDLFIWLNSKNHCATKGFLTRGVTDKKSKLALAKCVREGIPLQLSFVHTSQENMDRNVQQLNETLDTIKSVDRDYKPFISYLKSCCSELPKNLFRGFPVHYAHINALGRAKELPPQDRKYFSDYKSEDFDAHNVIEPSGKICFSHIVDGEVVKVPTANLFHKSIHKLPALMERIKKERT